MREMLYMIALMVLISCISADLYETTNSYLRDLNTILNNANEYQNSNLPPRNDSEPIQINVTMQIISLQDISEETMSFRADIYLFQRWTDLRLNMSDKYNLTLIPLHSSMLELFWLPDTFFSNVIEAINPTNDDDRSFSHRNQILLNSSGAIQYSQRLSLTGRCPMDLKMYPFDFQVCRLVLESYNFDDSVLDYNWEIEPVFLRLSEDQSLPDFTIIDVSSAKTVTDEAGKKYSRLYICFLMQRKSGFYFMELYVPAGFIVTVAWLASIAGHSSFGDILAVLLAMLFLYFSYITVMPKVSDFKAIDLYLTVCFLFVFLALIQKFLIHELLRLDDHMEESKTTAVESMKVSTSEEALHPKITKKQPTRSCISKKCLLTYVLYPSAFCIFCIVYFLTYSGQSPTFSHFSNCQ